MAVLTDRLIKLADLTFHYCEAGDPTAPPLVLLHALGLEAHNWDAITLMLAERYHVFALDQRGHGKSSRTEQYSFEAMRDDLKAFVDALSIGSFTLIGHSMGGSVAFIFAERWPERIARLVVEDTPPPFILSTELAGRFSDPPDEPPQPVSYDWRLVKPIIRQLRSPDPAWWEKLTTISAPTLLIGGGSTSHVPQEKLLEVAELVPDCRLVTIEGAGHNVHRKSQEAYMNCLRDFLF
ncbi:alpha/beta hydrolase [Ktedonosporobacter rubrisoli]|uniref:Alpha/beta hydrolase n=1 Tax=Ktedonosporobacter rubrisoli TaxID=2509675 RepID=A0A4P6JIK3_KTERU|nr:alpha/beta hydrolase [Ktedonosporobacter rubrisoli]QBD74742.1 alpha/beta hydrolase [Ktedonosporobacter rubrisoli]